MTDTTTETDRPDARTIMRGSNGFDEIAVKQRFGTELQHLEGTAMLRACIFLEARKGGATDATAYEVAMGTTLDGLLTRFPQVDDDRTAFLDGDDTPEALERMARFCVVTGYTPDQYLALTLEQRDAMTRVINESRSGA